MALIECPDCEIQVSDAAPRRSSRAWGHSMRMMRCFLLFAIIAAAPASADLIKCTKPDGSLYVGPTPPEHCLPTGSVRASSDHTASDSSDQQAAIDSCKRAVEARLVSPGTASWKVNAAHRGGTRYEVLGSVDSQNRAGGLMRSHFACDAEFAGGDRWNAHVSWLHDGGTDKSTFDFKR